MADARIGEISPKTPKVNRASPENRNSFIEDCAERLKVVRSEQEQIATDDDNARESAFVERLNDSVRDAD